jgi:hypothetical protein
VQRGDFLELQALGKFALRQAQPLAGRLHS